MSVKIVQIRDGDQGYLKRTPDYAQLIWAPLASGSFADADGLWEMTKSPDFIQFRPPSDGDRALVLTNGNVVLGPPVPELSALRLREFVQPGANPFPILALMEQPDTALGNRDGRAIATTTDGAPEVLCRVHIASAPTLVAADFCYAANPPKPAVPCAQVTLVSQGSNLWLRLDASGCTATTPTDGKVNWSWSSDGNLCDFQLHDHGDGTVSFESIAKPNVFLAMIPSALSKSRAATPGSSNVWDMDMALPSGDTLALGTCWGWGPAARFGMAMAEPAAGIAYNGALSVAPVDPATGLLPTTVTTFLVADATVAGQHVDGGSGRVGIAVNPTQNFTLSLYWSAQPNSIEARIKAAIYSTAVSQQLYPQFDAVKTASCADLSPNNNAIALSIYNSNFSDIQAVADNFYTVAMSNNSGTIILQNFDCLIPEISDSATLPVNIANKPAAFGILNLIVTAGLVDLETIATAATGSLNPTLPDPTLSLGRAQANMQNVVGNLIYATSELMSAFQQAINSCDYFVGQINNAASIAKTNNDALPETIDGYRTEISGIISGVQDHLGGWMGPDNQTYATYSNPSDPTAIIIDGYYYTPNVSLLNQVVNDRSDWFGFVIKHGWGTNPHCWADGNVNNQSAGNLRLPGEMVAYVMTLMTTASQDIATMPELTAHCNDMVAYWQSCKADWQKRIDALLVFKGQLTAFGGPAAISRAKALAGALDAANAATISGLIDQGPPPQAKGPKGPALASSVEAFFAPPEAMLPDIPSIALDTFADAISESWRPVAKQLSVYDFSLVNP